MSKPRLIDCYMAEVVMFGGLPVTRHDAHKAAVALEYDRQQIDWFVWRLSAVDAAPMDTAEFLAIVLA